MGRFIVAVCLGSLLAAACSSTAADDGCAQAWSDVDIAAEVEALVDSLEPALSSCSPDRWMEEAAAAGLSFPESTLSTACFRFEDSLQACAGQ